MSNFVQGEPIDGLLLLAAAAIFAISVAAATVGLWWGLGTLIGLSVFLPLGIKAVVRLRTARRRTK